MEANTTDHVPYDPDCPICGPGVRMFIRNTKPVGGYRRRYRECEVCGRRDVVLLRPESVTSIRVLDRYSRESCDGESALD